MVPKSYTADDGTTLIYRDFGDRGATTIVLCHGLGASGLQFLADAAYFSTLGFRVLVPDLRGHGRSGVPPDFSPERFSIAVLAADMVGMLNHAQVGSVHWVGNSLGGIIAFDLLGKCPERFLSLATFGTAYALNLPAAAGPLLVWLYRLFGANLVAQVCALTTTRYRPARPLIATMLKELNPKAAGAITGHVRHYDLTANALAYSGPMLVLVGGRDTAVNLALRPALQRIGTRPNFTIVEISEGGHCANLDATAAFRAALLAFWAA